MLTASRTISSTAAISSMKTPALLMRAISFTPRALITVVKTISTVPRITALTAKSYLPVPSPKNWNADQICGSVNW